MDNVCRCTRFGIEIDVAMKKKTGAFRIYAKLSCATDGAYKSQQRDAHRNRIHRRHCIFRMTDFTEPVRTLKCVLVGDAAVGKTSLIVSYTTNGYPQNYVPTAFDNYSVVVRVDKKPIRLQLCDTAGQSSFDTLRPLSYPDADVFIIVYSVVDPQSFAEIPSHWLPEINRANPVAKCKCIRSYLFYLVHRIGTQAVKRSESSYIRVNHMRCWRIL
ncbi:Ras family protein, partial [Necator americanus]